ncbi:ribonuclease H2 subunit C, putative [Plasmodium ovale]|uniref:Ribonuclease H2 subunit C, putative n=2 Tax=Plasmodium ovale TaxID=36330 RepID=A0A1A8VXT0_PLAOA|nr:ribonuclease H2 subunit C, putative [Plasmodium ovale curtisi]SBS92528.1 ribonuclease H2 subunit C, putative [Plasmodium ovale curtisi]SCQ16140.1 ribonuclease H2 subunit C, putative [Plasmodium ovale]
MNSFFCEDTKEEENLLQTILKRNTDELPPVVKQITTSHLIKNGVPEGESHAKKEAGCVKGEQTHTRSTGSNIGSGSGSGHSPDRSLGGDGFAKEDEGSAHTNEELLSVPLDTNIFPFHVKKSGRINADVFFLPYKSENDKDVITAYTYNYDYYDIYSENIELTNKSFHANKRKFAKASDIAMEKKRIKVKEEKDDQQNGLSDTPTTGGEKTYFEKLLVHFRGRLFIGNQITYSFFKTKTYLATIENNDEEKKGKELHNTNKIIKTYNLIQYTTYWKQDEYPDVDDPSMQKLFFFHIVPRLSGPQGGEQANEYSDTGDVVF